MPSLRKLLNRRGLRVRAYLRWRRLAGGGGDDIPLDLRTRWIVPVNQPMVLISQIQRSGGTLLTRLFDDHPKCFVHPYELTWGDTVKGTWPDLDTSSTADALFARLIENEKWIRKFIAAGRYLKRTSAADPHPFIFSPAMHRHVFDALAAERRFVTPRDALEAYLSGFFAGWLDYQNLYRGPKQCVVAFTPRLVMHLDSVARFQRDYPDGHLVSIVRAPASWMASLRRHDAGWVRQPTDRLLELWSDAVHAAITTHDKAPERVTVVLFEDLVQRTDRVMAHLCRRLRLDWADSLRHPTYNGRAIRSNSSFDAQTSVDPLAADRTAHLDDDDRRAIPDSARSTYAEAAARFAIDASGRDGVT